MAELLRRVWVGFVVVLILAGCAAPSDPARHILGTERMPGPASVWLTADLASPPQAITIEMTSADLEMRRTHTSPTGELMRGSFPVSEGQYRLSGQGGACTLDLVLLPEREADVVIELRDEGCEFAVVDEHRYDSGLTHEEPAVLVAPRSIP